MVRDDSKLIARLLTAPLDALLAEACARRDARGPARMTYSPKVFIPLTRLCADVCHYCTFATTPSQLPAPYLTPEEVLDIARAGAAAGCKEALFTLGDAPERRYDVAAQWLQKRGFSRTIDYVRHCAELVLNETGLLPHINAGVLEEAHYLMLRPVAASVGLMLESTSTAICEKGGAHYGSPDKVPAVRIASLAAAGRARVPTTSGILIGIGETPQERIESLIALRDLHLAQGHLQEVIVQNFCPKPGTKMSAAPEASEADFLRVIAAARIVLPDEVSVQAPPNLNGERLVELIGAGIDDWGGISPVTLDHVNPEAPWPEIAVLEEVCAKAGRPLVERLTIYPRFVNPPPLGEVAARRADGGGTRPATGPLRRASLGTSPRGGGSSDASWIDAKLRPHVLKFSDSEGLARDSVWSPGVSSAPPGTAKTPMGRRYRGPVASTLHKIIDRASSGIELSEGEIVSLFAARGAAAQAVIEAADELRRQVKGDTVTYVINRNINYTNICTYACTFCAFSKSSSKAGFRDKPYLLGFEEVANRAREAVAKGATEVCLQGGIHPSYTGETYSGIVRAVRAACPDLHIHAFSPLEIAQGASTLGVSSRDFLMRLKDDGLGSLPGTSAEILCDDVRDVICPDKQTVAEWLGVVRDAHRLGIPTTSTIMYGHIERPEHWARHLLALRHLQDETGGITEFVPLPLIHMESPMYRRGQSRKGPTWREALMMHAVARIVLHGSIDSIQCSWVKLGTQGAAAALCAGANDLGGVLMNESISRAAGAEHGQEISVDDLRGVAAAAGRNLRRRSTLYRLLDDVEAEPELV